MIEIIGIKKSIGKQFTFQIICHKDQNITILENKNDQVEFEKEDIVRSTLVKEYILSKLSNGIYT